MSEDSSSNLSRFIKKFDIFQFEAKLNIDGNEKKSTLIGGFCSILLFLLSFILVIINFTIYFMNIKPSIINTSIFIKNKLPIEVSLDRFSIIQYFFDANFMPIVFPIKQNSIYNQLVSYENGKPIFTINPVGINKMCKNTTLNSFYEYGEKYYSNVFLASLCANYYKITNISLGGDPVLSTKQSKLFDVMIFNLCNDTDLATVCNNSTELLKKMQLKPYTISIIYENYYFEPNVPIGFSNFTDYSRFTSTSNKDLLVTITLIKNTVISDDNLLFGFLSPKNYTFYSISKVEYVESDRVSNISNLQIKKVYELDPINMICFRSYGKMDAILASTLSIVGLIKMFFQVFLNFYHSENISSYLIKRLYFFENEKEIEKLFDLNKSEIINPISKSSPNLDELEKIQANQDETLKIKIINTHIDSLKPFSKLINQDLFNQAISFKGLSMKYFLFKICICRRDPRFYDSWRLYFIAKKILKYDLNIVNIIKKLIEFETAKELIFNKNQLKFMKIIYNRRINNLVDTEFLSKELDDKLYDMNINRKEYLNEHSSSYNNFVYSNDSIDKRIIKRIKIF